MPDKNGKKQWIIDRDKKRKVLKTPGLVKTFKNPEIIKIENEEKTKKELEEITEIESEEPDGRSTDNP